MTTERNEDQQTASSSTVSWTGMVEKQYRKIKEHAETYPYVWASYILVYGGFALWTTYRWRKLRRTEDRVRALQVRLHELVGAKQESVNSSASSIQKASQSSVLSVEKGSSGATPVDKSTSAAKEVTK